MPFYRCTPPSSGGGGGGGSVNIDDYLTYFDDNGNKKYFTSFKVQFTANNDTLKFDDSTLINNIYIDVAPPNTYTMRIGKNITSAPSFLSGRTWDMGIIIENGLRNADMMFSRANVHHPISFPESCTRYLQTFSGVTTSFNSKVTFACNYIENGYAMFNNCRNFNIPILFPLDSGNCSNIQYALLNCLNYNSPILIKSNNVNASGLTYGCANMFSDIIFDCSAPLPTTAIYYNKMLYKGAASATTNRARANIYARDLAPFMQSNVGLTNGAVLTWATTTNGYYNALFNVYLLNNVQDAVNNFYNIYNNI